MANQTNLNSPTLDPAPTPARRGMARFNLGDSLGLAGIYLLLCLALFIATPYFLTFSNFSNIFRDSAVIGIIAIAMTFVIVSGGIDLSVGSVVALVGVTIAQLSNSIPIGAAVAIALGVGIVFGLFNGFAVTRIGINPLIATLGTLSIGRGLALIFSGGLSQSINSDAFAFLGQGRPLGVPFPVILMLVLFALAAWIMRATVYGRSIYAVGGNPNASRLAGLPVSNLQLSVYLLCALAATLGGLIQASQLGAGAPAAAQGIELSVIAAVILGGTSLSGGKGTIFGTLLGVLILGTLNNGLTLLSVSSYYQDVARGVVLLLAVGLDQLRLRVAARD